MSASNFGPSLIGPNVGVRSHCLYLSGDCSWDPPMRNALPGWLHVALIVSFASQPALAKEVCDAQSTKGEVCLCKLSDRVVKSINQGRQLLAFEALLNRAIAF